MTTNDESSRRVREMDHTAEAELAPDGTWTGRFDALGLETHGHATADDARIAAARAMVQALNDMPRTHADAWFEANTVLMPVGYDATAE